MQIDVTASPTPETSRWDLCGEQPCLPLYPSGTVPNCIGPGNKPCKSAILSYEGFRDRFAIVDVGGETVVIDVAAPADKFDEFLPKAQEVLDTVEWEGVQGSSIQEEGENSGPL